MDEEQTKYCEMENGCLFCDRLLCEGKKEEKSNNSLNGRLFMNYICPKCGKTKEINAPYHQKGHGWFVGAFCFDCNYLYTEVRNAPSEEKAIELLKKKLSQNR